MTKRWAGAAGLQWRSELLVSPHPAALVVYRVVCSITSSSVWEGTPGEAQRGRSHTATLSLFPWLTALCGFKRDAEESNDIPRGTYTWKPFLGPKQQNISSTSLAVASPQIPFSQDPSKMTWWFRSCSVFVCMRRDTFPLGKHFSGMGERIGDKNKKVKFVGWDKGWDANSLIG